MEIIIGLPTLVVETLTDPSLSVVLTDAILRLMKFRFRMKTVLLPKFIPQS